MKKSVEGEGREHARATLLSLEKKQKPKSNENKLLNVALSVEDGFSLCL